MKYFENYIEVKKVNPINLKGRIRNIALDGLFTLNHIKGYTDYLKKPRVQFLYIHHVFKDEEHKLDALLKRLSIQHTFISYSEAVTKILENEIDKPYICISSDDGFKNNISAAKIFNEYDVSCCFFVNPFILENHSYSEIEKYCKTQLNFPPVKFMDWNDIEKLQQWGHEIGSHTMNHINVANTTEEDFQRDCYNTFEILSQKCGDIKHFAFPYGRFFHFNDSAREIVFKSGFISCASAERGCHINNLGTIDQEELCIRRDHVILDWKLDHVFYFLINNSKNANFHNNLFPYKT